MYHLLILTPEKIVFDGQVTTTKIPGSEGCFEVLKNHAALISLLKEGTVNTTDAEGKKLSWVVTGGVVEVFKNNVRLLADSVKEAKV